MVISRLLTLASALEAGAGAALVVHPPTVARLLLGADLSDSGIALGRIGGCGLLALGVACWPHAGESGNSIQVLQALLTYNLLVTLCLAWLGVTGALVGILLWPAVMLHGVLTLLLARAWLGDAGRNRRTL